MQNFFNWFLKLTNQKRPKVTCLVHQSINQSINYILFLSKSAYIEINYTAVDKKRQCTLKGQARYVNVRGSVHWKGVYKEVIKIDIKIGSQSLNCLPVHWKSLKLTNHK